MSALIDALRVKYKNPKEALIALGFDESLVKTSNGPDTRVGEANLMENDPMSKKSLSKKAVMAKGALLAVLRPKLAADKMPDFDVVLADVTQKTWLEKKAGIVAACKAKMAADADVGALVELLDSLDGEEPSDDDVAVDDDDTPPADEPVEDEGSDVKTVIAQVMETLKKLMEPAAAADKPAMDNPPPTEGTPPAPDKMDKPAMDAAIKKAVKDAEASTIARLRAISQAEEDIKPYVGKLAVAMDSAEDVYKAALTTMGVETKDIHPSAYKAVLDAQVKPQPRIATDSAAPQGTFAERFPNAARIRLV